MQSSTRFLKTFFIWFIFLLVLGSQSLVVADAEDPFPQFPSLTPNVEFWKLIYTQYHTRQGVIHDAQNVLVIYEVIELQPSHSRSLRRQNSKLIKKTSQKYQKILEELAKGKTPTTTEEAGVYALFGPNPDPKIFLEAAGNIRFQRGQADRFKEGIIRSGRYLETIKKIFIENGLPVDLAYLPHVESSFNYEAYSKFGAAGIWQFTYSTGKRFMSIDYTVDERRDPITAAYAAAKLLKQNFEKLGDWALAVTAYNHGVNSMLRAQKEKGDFESILNEYDGRRFKFASKNFYSEFLAARDIAKNSVAYFGELQLEQPFPAEIVTIPGFVSVKKIADHFNTDVNSIRYLNPALRKPVFDDQKFIPKGYRLRVPLKDDTIELAKNMPPDLFELEQKRSRFYYVQKGDVAGSIARKHDITLQELIWANNLNHRATIYVGQNLRIPTKEDSIQLTAKHALQVAAAEAEETTDSVANDEPTSPQVEFQDNGESQQVGNVNLSVVTGNLSVKSIFKKDGRTYGVIRVDTGETLGHFAEWLEVTTQSIRRINRFRYGQLIDFNDRVIIPLDRISKEQFEEKRFEYHKEFEEDFLGAYTIETVKKYVIKPGDNIWTLCLDVFELPFWLIRKYNQDLDFMKLQPSQIIMVPIVEKVE